MTCRVEYFVRETTAGDGEGVEVVLKGSFVGEGIDTEGEPGDDAYGVATEAADQIVDSLLAIGGVFARADDGEEGHVGGRQGATVVELQWRLRNFP